MRDFLEKHKAVERLHEQIFEGDSNGESLEQVLKTAVKASEEDAKRIKSLFNQTSGVTKELSDFYVKIFGSEDEDGLKSGGLQAELDNGLKRLVEFEAQQALRYKALNEQIESLLPGATSAGLASAYRNMKESFDRPIKSANKIFYGAIASLVFVAFLSAVKEIYWFGVKFNDFSNWQALLGGLATKIPYYAPLVWLAFYASSRRSEYQRLMQEYAHKETLANSYESYKKQIESLGSERDVLMRSLMEKAIDAIAYNASQTLDGKHGDKMPAIDLIDKLIEKIPAGIVGK